MSGYSVFEDDSDNPVCPKCGRIIEDEEELEEHNLYINEDGEADYYEDDPESPECQNPFNGAGRAGLL